MSATGRTVGSAARAIAPQLALLWGVTTATFVAMNCLPGNAAQARLGASGSSTEERALAARLGLDQSLLERYLHWLSRITTGRLGDSYANGQSVWKLVDERLPVSGELVGLVLLVAVGSSVPVALVCALRPGGPLDRAVMAVGVTALSLAPFVLGIGLVSFFAVRLGWFPAIGYVAVDRSADGNLQSMALPTCTLALPLSGVYSRLLRADLVDQLQQKDYILTARATGASPWRVLWRHALPNAVFGSISVVALSLGTLIGGTVIVEQIFALPGVGSELTQAIQARDANVVAAIVLIVATSVLAANGAAEWAYHALDRRVGLEH